MCADDIAYATDEIVARNAELYDVRTGTFSTSKFLLVRALAEEPTSVFDEAYRSRHGLSVSSTVHTALRELIEAGVVEGGRASTPYTLVDPFFARYLLRSPAFVFAGKETS